MYRAAGRVQPPRRTDVGRLRPVRREPRARRIRHNLPLNRRRETIDEHQRIRDRERAGRQRLGARAPERPERPLRRGRRRHDGLRAEPHPGRRRLELDEPAVRRHPARHRQSARTSAKLLSDSGIGPDTTIVLYGDNNNWFAAWAYWQLKLYGHKDVRIINGGRKYWLDNGLALSVDDALVRRDRIPAARGRLQPARLPRRHPATSRRPRPRARRRPLAGRVQRRDHRAPGHERDRPAGRPHPRRRLDPVGPDRQGGRHVQERRGPRHALRGEGRDPRQGRHRLLPDRRAVEPSAGSSCTSCSATTGSATTTARGPSTAA